RIEPSRRRENLSWSSHREVASLEAREQDRWLDRAERGDGPDQPWRRARLREALSKAHGRRSCTLEETLDRLGAAVRGVVARAPVGEKARQAIAQRLHEMGDEVLRGGGLRA